MDDICLDYVYQYMLGTDWKAALQRRTLRSWWTSWARASKVILQQERPTSSQGWMRKTTTRWLREVILLLYSTLVTHISTAGSSSELPSTRKTWTYWSESNEGQRKWLNCWSTCNTRGDWELGQIRLEKRRLRRILQIKSPDGEK